MQYHDGAIYLTESAIRVCAMKVSSVTGDMRKAFDVCRRAIEVAENKFRKQKVLQPTAGKLRTGITHKFSILLIRLSTENYSERISVK